MPYTRLAELDGLEINLISSRDLFEEQFVLILKDDFIDSNTKGVTPSSSSKFIAQVLNEFGDVLTNELPDELPPVREVNHKIELVPGAEP